MFVRVCELISELGWTGERDRERERQTEKYILYIYSNMVSNLQCP